MNAFLRHHWILEPYIRPSWGYSCLHTCSTTALRVCDCYVDLDSNFWVLDATGRTKLGCMWTIGRVFQLSVVSDNSRIATLKSVKWYDRVRSKLLSLRLWWFTSPFLLLLLKNSSLYGLIHFPVLGFIPTVLLEPQLYSFWNSAHYILWDLKQEWMQSQSMR